MKKLNLSESEKESLSKDGFVIVDQCQQSYNRELFMLEMAKLADRYLINGTTLKINVILPGQISSVDVNFNWDDLLDENK